MAGERQKSLVSEFQDKYTSLRTRAFRVPVDHARAIAEKFECPLQVAIVAYLIDMDSILSLRKAIDLIAYELQRRARVGENIPNIPGNVLDFAINEGKWIEYVYGNFARDMELKTRSIFNLEGALDTEAATVEQALLVLRERTKVAGGFVAPIIEEWIKEHPKATSRDALLVFGPALTKWPRSTFLGRLPVIRRRNQALFRLLVKILSTASDSAVVDATANRIQSIIDDLSQDFTKLSPVAVGHLLLHMTPKLQGRGDKSPYVEFGSASTRGSKIEPDMSSPFDFLERDIHLAGRRQEEDRERYLKQRIARVLHVLEHNGTSIEEGISQTINEIKERFNISTDDLDTFLEHVIDDLKLVPIDQREIQAAQFVFQFISDHIYNR